MTHLSTNTKAQTGFTIVELLIVIVVIGILAAITIVAYSGITARANTTKNVTNAENVGKVADAYNADPPTGMSGYPADPAAIAGYTTGVTKAPAGVTIQAAIPVVGTPTVISYVAKGTAPFTGACMGYWNYSTGVVNYLAVGNANASTVTSCS